MGKYATGLVVKQIRHDVQMLRQEIRLGAEFESSECPLGEHNYEAWLIACLIMRMQPKLCPLCLYPFPVVDEKPPEEAFFQYDCDYDGGEVIHEGDLP